MTNPLNFHTATPIVRVIEEHRKWIIKKKNINKRLNVTILFHSFHSFSIRHLGCNTMASSSDFCPATRTTMEEHHCGTGGHESLIFEQASSTGTRCKASNYRSQFFRHLLLTALLRLIFLSYFSIQNQRNGQNRSFLFHLHSKCVETRTKFASNEIST